MTEIQDPLSHAWLMNFSALSYANQWYVTDREFMEIVRPCHAGAVDPESLGRLAAKYMVARGFKKSKRKADDALRWQKAANLLATAADQTISVEDIVDSLATELGKVAPVKDNSESMLTSAATKFLWFAKRHDVRILDKRAISALTLLTGERGLGREYSRYASAWNDQFGAHRTAIRQAIAQLPEQLEWTCISEADHNEATAVFTEGWFADRVFDKYLWTVGASSNSATSLDEGGSRRRGSKA